MHTGRVIGSALDLTKNGVMKRAGIDTPHRDNLLAANHDLEGMRKFIGADSLGFLSIDGLYRALGHDKRDAQRPQFTDHCFTGDYPTRLTDMNGESVKQQLSLLAEAS